MKEKIIEILSTYEIDINLINNFFINQNIDNDLLKKVKEKIIIYPCCDLDIIGVYPKVVNNILIDYKIRIPKIKNVYSALIYIHELIHGLILDSNINKHFNENDIYEEVLPMYYEDLFINYLNNKKISLIYEEYIKERYIDNNIDEKYIVARNIITNKFKNLNRIIVKQKND